MKYNDFSEGQKEFHALNNRDAFVNYFGVPEGGDEGYYRSKEFIRNFFERNNVEFNDDLKPIMR
jgi:hypothetical protein